MSFDTFQGEFSVYQFYPDGQYQRVKAFVSDKEASDCVADLVWSVGGVSGAIQRIIVTDGGDCINFEWQHGEGVTFPPGVTL